MGVLQGFATKRPSDWKPQQDDESSSTADDTIIRRNTPLATPPSASLAAAPSQPHQVVVEEEVENRGIAAAKHLVCGGVAGSVAKTVTAPFSRLTILFQVHSMVTTKEHRPRFAMTMGEGVQKIVERGGFRSLWKGNATSVLHRFPFSAINFSSTRMRSIRSMDYRGSMRMRMAIPPRPRMRRANFIASLPVPRQEVWRASLAIRWIWSVPDSRRSWRAGNTTGA